jgi:hypothetical protein
MLHKCPAPLCGGYKSPGVYMCRKCWNGVPAHLKVAWRQCAADPAKAESRATLLKRIFAFFQESRTHKQLPLFPGPIYRSIPTAATKKD